MKVYLDDVRKAPEDWVQTRWPQDTIELLKTGNVTHLSLDHDLGKDAPENDDDLFYGTGYDVLLWIEKEVVTNNFNPPLITIHSANSGAWPKMAHAIDAIERLAAKHE